MKDAKERKVLFKGFKVLRYIVDFGFPFFQQSNACGLSGRVHLEVSVAGQTGPNERLEGNASRHI